MVDFAEHRKALLCNDAASIADYSSAMDQATKAVAAWLQNEKMYTGGIRGQAGGRRIGQAGRTNCLAAVARYTTSGFIRPVTAANSRSARP